MDSENSNFDLRNLLFPSNKDIHFLFFFRLYFLRDLTWDRVIELVHYSSQDQVAALLSVFFFLIAFLTYSIILQLLELKTNNSRHPEVEWQSPIFLFLLILWQITISTPSFVSFWFWSCLVESSWWGCCPGFCYIIIAVMPWFSRRLSNKQTIINITRLSPATYSSISLFFYSKFYHYNSIFCFALLSFKLLFN